MKVRVRCVRCSVVIRITVRDGDYGKRVLVRCPECRQGLRATLPRKPDPAAGRETKKPDFADLFAHLQDGTWK